MPTYEYACRACGERLEVVQSFSDAPLTECPSCGGDLRKVFSPVGIAFKGSGFYKNDSRGSKKSTTATGSSSSDSKSESKSETKSESKPAEKQSSDSSSSSSTSSSSSNAAAS
jgi:putative FmdB family regulatory protein